MIPQQNYPNNVPLTNPQITEPIEEPNTSKGFGCKSCLYIIIIITLISTFIVLIIIFTVKLWFPSLFEAIYPRSAYPAIYTESIEKEIVKYYDTTDWTRIDFGSGYLLVPFKGNMEEGDYEEFDAKYYDFGEQGVVSVQSNDKSLDNSNLKMKQGCTASYKDFEHMNNIGDHIYLSLLLLYKSAFYTSESNLASSYYEDDEYFCCLLGNYMNSSTYSFIIIPNTSNPERDSNYTFIHIESNNIDEKGLTTIVSTIEITP